MKRGLLFFTLPLMALFISTHSSAQYDNAGDYLDAISKSTQPLSEKYLFYLSGMSHGKNARKVEKRRQDLLTSISNARSEIMGMPPFKKDRTLKDTTVAYLKMLNNIFNEDYGKIVNMEEIAEQSYDLMEAYMLAKEKANEKLNDAAKKQHDTQAKFAANNNIRLIEQTSELDSKMEVAEKVMKNYNDAYLVFFKGYKQEMYVMDALTAKNIISIEQNISTLEKYANEGLDKLKEMKGYNNDGSLIAACTNLMQFYKSEAKKASQITDFFLKEESFAKIKKQFDAKPSSKRTQADVDQFNKAVSDINSAGVAYNALNGQLNKERGGLIDAWNKAVKNFMDDYMPMQRKN